MYIYIRYPTIVRFCRLQITYQFLQVHSLRVGWRWRKFFPFHFVFANIQPKNCVNSTNANNSYVHFYIDNSTNANPTDIQTDRLTDSRN
jgi:hypothetical protein